MNIIYVKWLSVIPVIFLTAGAAAAQDFTAGKTPAQLFSSDCSTCHHQPNGLGKRYDTGSLAGFLLEHYTTKPDSAGALAKYVMGFATLRAAPVTAPSGEEGVAAKSGEEPKGRRRNSDLSGDGEKSSRSRRTGNEEPAKPPAAEAAVQPQAAPRNARAARGHNAESESSPPVAKLHDYARSGAPVVARESADPISRIRAYAASGAGAEEAAAEAPKLVSGKSHRRSDAAAPPVAAAPAEPDPTPAPDPLPAASAPAEAPPPGASAAAPDLSTK